MCVLSQSLAAPSRDRERATLFEFELSEQRNPVAVGRVRVCVESVCVVWCEAAQCVYESLCFSVGGEGAGFGFEFGLGAGGTRMLTAVT